MGQVVGFPSKNYARMQYNPRNTIEYFPMANAQIFLRVTFVESSPKEQMLLAEMICCTGVSVADIACLSIICQWLSLLPLQNSSIGEYNDLMYMLLAGSTVEPGGPGCRTPLPCQQGRSKVS